MPDTPHPVFACEGWPSLLGCFIAATGVHVTFGLWWALPLWILFAFALRFFHDPARPIPQEPKAVLSPANGRIVAIEPVRDPWLDRNCLKISVFMNVFNLHSNRSPVDGDVKQVWYTPGKFISAHLDKASTENERNALHIRTAEGQDVTCVQIAGLIARRILCYVDAGAKLSRGQRFGFIRFGSLVDLYLPVGSRARVTIGDKVSASATVLAELP